ncbi:MULTISPECIES: phage tail assembly protein [Novosphingobium]|uniref:phage tail assembly protein n=1 Tax=Novosphingobium sp. RL4 TaxID=3109595 RepID=UPI002D79CFDD|nr:phage tail assembly protein [Novosphingobium sp. RL4]WRT94285.1 phage tail assembly protein [Novosphingobium sp. RL4]
MTDATETRPETAVVTLDTPIVRGETKIAFLELRKPKGRALKGLSLVDLGQLKADALHLILPRITTPTITPAEAIDLDPADLLACGAEIGGFLLQKSQRTDVLAQ